MKSFKLKLFVVAGFSLALGANDTDSGSNEVLTPESKSTSQGTENLSGGVDSTPIDTVFSNSDSSGSEEKQTSFIEDLSATVVKVASDSKKLFVDTMKQLSKDQDKETDEKIETGKSIEEFAVKSQEIVKPILDLIADQAKAKLQEVSSTVGDVLEYGKAKASEVVANLDQNIENAAGVNKDNKSTLPTPLVPVVQPNDDQKPAKQATFTEFISEYRYAVGASVVIVAGAVSLYVYHLYNEEDQDTNGNGN